MPKARNPSKKPRPTKRFDVEQWAAEQDASSRQTRCLTCLRKDVSAAVLKVVKLRDEGKTLATNVALADMLQSEFGFHISPCALRRHIRTCIHGKTN